MYSRLLPVKPALIGVVHLPALPGSPFDKGTSLEEIEAFCVEEARTFERGGFDAVIVENAGDGPRMKQTPAETIAALGALTFSTRKSVSIPVGVSAGYDGMSTLGAAVAAGAHFMRAPIYLEASVTAAGIVEGTAGQMLRYRKAMGRDCAIFADIYIKHTSPLSRRPIIDAFKDAASSGFADALIISGVATGEAPTPDSIQPLRDSSDIPILIGSGTTAGNARSFLDCSNGYIVGTYCKDPKTGRVQEGRVREVVEGAGRG
jgi:membrane complex biogenesis BtpA family protein